MTRIAAAFPWDGRKRIVSGEVSGRILIIGGASEPTIEEVVVAGQQTQEHGIKLLRSPETGLLSQFHNDGLCFRIIDACQLIEDLPHQLA